MEKKLVPYSVYLPKEYHDKLKEVAKDRKAAGMVRDAICMILDGGDQYKSGYNKALRDAVKVIDSNKDVGIVALRGKYIADVLADDINQLEMK